MTSNVRPILIKNLGSGLQTSIRSVSVLNTLLVVGQSHGFFSPLNNSPKVGTSNVEVEVNICKTISLGLRLAVTGCNGDLHLCVDIPSKYQFGREACTEDIFRVAGLQYS